MTSVVDSHRASPGPTPYVLDRETAPAFWLVGILWLPMATGVQTGNRFTFIEQRMPGGLGPPTHRHPTMDEGFYVLEGTCAFHVHGETHEAGPGTFVHLPRGVPHSFEMRSAEARVVNFYTPAGFELVLAGCARPADARVLPTMAQSAPPASAEQVRILSRLFGQEAVLGLPFVDPPARPLMATEPPEPDDLGASAPLVVHADAAPAHHAFGITWRTLAAAEDTAGGYELSDVLAPARGALGPRGVARDEALYVVEGTLTLTVDGTPQDVTAGTFAYLPAGGTYAWRAGAGGARLLAFRLPGAADGAAASVRCGRASGDR